MIKNNLIIFLHFNFFSELDFAGVAKRGNPGHSSLTYLFIIILKDNFILIKTDNLIKYIRFSF